MWLYGTDLADMYRDRMPLRQLWVKLRALPEGSPLHLALAAAEVLDQDAEQLAGVNDALAMFGR